MTKPHYRLTKSGDLLPVVRATDGFQNIVANLGNSRDKSFGSAYVQSSMSNADLAAAYEVSSVAKAIVDMPAEDGCREWREWQAEAGQISKIEAEEKRLSLVHTVLTARKWARLFGGAAIYIGTGDSNPALPLNPQAVRTGGVKYLTALDRTELTADELQLDPREPGYGLPKYYRMVTGAEAMVRIHPSRLVIFRGPEFPDRQSRQANQGWGDSVLTAAIDKVKHLDATVANVASLVFEAKVDVVKIKDFTQGLRDGGTAYETLMLKRFALAMTGKGINGALMLDAEEEYDQKSANFSTLPDIMDRFMQVVSSAARIPMTRLFRMSPGGMNATGESDMRSYYDDVKKEQTLEIEPAMSLLDECLIRSALGNRPADIWYSWRPLWQPTAKERAENADKLTTALEKLHRMAIIPDEAVADAAVNALTESGAFPGLESAVAEYMTGTGEEGDDDDVGVADASPRTLYIHRKVLNASEIIRWAKAQGFKTTLPSDDMHVTIAFSRAPVDWMEVGQSWQDRLEVPAGGARLMEQFGDARALLFASDELKWRHERIKDAGAEWDHPEYQPHITISYEPDAPDIAEIEPYQGPIILGPEIFQEVKENWQEGIEEQ